LIRCFCIPYVLIFIFVSIVGARPSGQSKRTVDAAGTAREYAPSLEGPGNQVKSLRTVSRKQSEKQKRFLAKQILNRWVNAVGGLDRLRQVKAVYTLSGFESGSVTGTVEEWGASPGQHREHRNLGGVYDTLKVFDSGQNMGWLRDQNGRVQELRGVDLEDEVTVAYLSSFSYLIPDRMSGVVEFLGSDKTRKYYLLKVSPHSGRPVTFYLEKKTYLPARQERQSGDGTLTTYYSDWRDVHGLKISFQQRQSTGDPKYDAILKLQQLRFDIPLEQTTFGKPAEWPRDFEFVSGTEAREIPFEIYNNHVYLQIQMNGGKSLRFLLDTGAEITVVDQATAEAQKLALLGPVEVTGAAGSTELAWTKIQSFKLPGVSLNNQVVGVIALDGLEPLTGRRIDGILGYDFFSRFVVEINYVKLVINLYDPSSYKYDGPGESLPITLEGSVPYLRTTIVQMGNKPIEGKFNIDTGSSGSLTLNTPFVNSHRLLKFTSKTVPVPLAGVGGTAEQHIGRIGELRLGRLSIKNPIAGFSQSAQGDFASRNFDGVIGNEVLRRFDTVVDYSRQRLILSPNIYFDAPYEYDMSGAILTAEPPNFPAFAVRRVFSDSPAAEAGLRVGDRIMAIDGQPASRYALGEVRQMFREDGREYALSVSRGGQVLDIKIKLRRLI